MSRMKTFHSYALHSVLETMLHNILRNLLLFVWHSLHPLLYIFYTYMDNNVKLLTPVVLFCQVPRRSSDSITFMLKVHTGQKINGKKF